MVVTDETFWSTLSKLCSIWFIYLSLNQRNRQEKIDQWHKDKNHNLKTGRYEGLHLSFAAGGYLRLLKAPAVNIVTENVEPEISLVSRGASN